MMIFFMTDPLSPSCPWARPPGRFRFLGFAAMSRYFARSNRIFSVDDGHLADGIGIERVAGLNTAMSASLPVSREPVNLSTPLMIVRIDGYVP
jgi:hypothetical protein